MSVYAEYRNAKTDEERELAKIGMMWESRKEAYLDGKYHAQKNILDGKYHFVETDNEYDCGDELEDEEDGEG